jgi:hypothetical protein
MLASMYGMEYRCAVVRIDNATEPYRGRGCAGARPGRSPTRCRGTPTRPPEYARWSQSSPCAANQVPLIFDVNISAVAERGVCVHMRGSLCVRVCVCAAELLFAVQAGRGRQLLLNASSLASATSGAGSRAICGRPMQSESHCVSI